MNAEAVDDYPSMTASVGSAEALSINAGSLGSRQLLHTSVDRGARSWSEFFCTRRSWVRQVQTSFKTRIKRCRPDFGSDGAWAMVPTVKPGITLRNLCLSTQPPTSIAVSPNGRCIAFGCGSAVEMYWLSQQIGRIVNRSFSLGRPADHLHFQPPRRFQDRRNDLKLIASARPVANIQKSLHPDDAHAGTTVLSLHRYTLESWNHAIWTVLRKTAHPGTHGNGIPLGDGIHVLFTCEMTGLLCLGTEQPEGHTHQLKRKFVLVPPQELWQNGHPPSPSIYAAADFSSHADETRISAAYGDHIILFTIPVDMLRFSATETEGPLPRNSNSLRDMGEALLLRIPDPPRTDLGHSKTDSESGGLLNMKWVNWLSTAEDWPSTEPDEIWPVRIDGICVGEMTSPQALAVQDIGEISVWAFGGEGAVRLWRG